MKKLENMDEKRWAKRVHITCKTQSAWFRELERWKSKEEISDTWQDIGVKEIKRKIEENVLKEWKKGMETKITLRWYKNMESIGREEWYMGDWGGKLLFKVRSGTLELNGRNREKKRVKMSAV